MKEIKVRLGERSYPIVVGAGNLRALAFWLKRAGVSGDAVVVTNPLVRRLHGQALLKALKKGGYTVKVFEVADSERSKSVKVAFDLVEPITRGATSIPKSGACLVIRPSIKINGLSNRRTSTCGSTRTGKTPCARQCNA